MLCSIPGHQQGITCKAPRSDDQAYEVIRRKPAPAKAGEGAIEGNAADDALMGDQGGYIILAISLSVD
jgi:hypothetical protein